MKKEQNKTRFSPLSKEEWEELVERYFEAQTTDDEEQRLRAFLLTDEAAGREFDEVKAVMGFLSMGKSKHCSKKRYQLPIYGKRWAAAVVIFCVISSIAWQITYRRENVCVAYIYGEKCTDSEVVMSQLKNSLLQIQRTEGDVMMEEQLSDMFQTLDGEEVTTNKK